ncbi:MAG: DUF1361 domain-containing protein [Anaerolineales bacterium]|nr:DUF1361 domain-containing protein [Anaerolineales bacterium]
MLKRFIEYKHKYRLLTLILLIASSVIAVGMVAARMLYSGTRTHLSLVDNLLLAWIPFIFAYLTHVLAARRSWLYLIIPITALAWLIFFPNAPYILTDLQHLITSVKGGAPLWYDVILLVWFAWTGLLLGVISLYLMQEIVKRAFGPLVSWGFVILISLLSSLGIYLGRFLRWNSWDIWQNPTAVLGDIFDIFRHPFTNKSAVGFTIIYTVFFLFIYFTLYAFGHQLHEQNQRELEN